MFTRILVPMDFSEPSEAALDYARALAARLGSSLHLLHVIETPMTAGPLGSEMFIAESPAVYEARLDEAKAHLTHRTGSARLLGIDVKTDVVNGSTAKAIVEYAISHGCSLIVMGTHGRTGISHLLMGSVAERVVREAPCPVLTVRQAPAEADLPVGVREATA